MSHLVQQEDPLHPDPSEDAIWSKGDPPGDCSDPLGRRSESPESNFGSEMSDYSKDPPPDFSVEPGPSERRHHCRPLQSESQESNFGSEMSDYSKGPPPDFSLEPGPSGRRPVQEKKGPSCSVWCQKVLKDPVSGDSSSPLCAEPSRKASSDHYSGLQEVLDDHKINLRSRCEHVMEGTNEGGSGTRLNTIYTELYITEGTSEEVNTQHEVRQLETTSKMMTVYESPIRCNDIFNVLPDQRRHIRVVLTNGVAGIGKSFSVQKFTLDWAEGLENQDVSLVVLLSFRELNLIKEEKYSLLRLLHVFHPTLQKVTAEELAVWRPLFIFDGLDESRLSLDFKKMERVSDANQESSVDVLLMNLIKGNLLPSALVWITSRPAAANQIPPECFDRVTEVRGFTDDQKEEYFKRRFPDEDLCRRIISNVKTSKSLYIMCQIPVFCWITATVLEHMLTPDQGGELPKTLTDMYSHFLLVQTKRKKQKYDEGHERSPQELMETDREVLLKLGRLAFKHLEEGNIMFYQEDLEQCGLDVSEALVYSGVCTEIFKRESVIFQKTVYCFVHLSIQEFLAAVYMTNCYTNRNTKELEDFLGDFFLRRAMEKSLESKNGHLDLFVRFLYGLSLESNQRLLKGLLGQTETGPEAVQRAINDLREINTDRISPDRSINIFYCLMEMNDQSVHQEIQEFLKSENRSKKKLSAIQCSALAYMLQVSEEVLDEFDLTKYRTSEEGRQRLIPVVRNCRKALLHSCGFSRTHAEVVTSALKSSPSHLIHLDLNRNKLQDSTVKLLSVGLESQNCRIQILRLVRCGLLETGCVSLASALKSNPSHLRELNLSYNELRDSGVTLLCEFLESPNCLLETLILNNCNMSEASCMSVASALKSNPAQLRVLDLGGNEQLQDSGAELLCGFLASPLCRLEFLKLGDCSLSKRSCGPLARTLISNPTHLKELQLRGNNTLLDSGMILLCEFLSSPQCRLEILRLSGCSLSGDGCGYLASALNANPSHLRVLQLNRNDTFQNVAALKLGPFLQNPESRLEVLRMWDCNMSDPGCSAVVECLEKNPSHIRELQLGFNKMYDGGMEVLCQRLLKNPECHLETLRVSFCGLSELSCSHLVSALRSNPSHLKVLELTNNKVQDSGAIILSEFLGSPECRLEVLRLSCCGLSELSCVSLISALKANHSCMKDLEMNYNNLKDSGEKMLSDFFDHPDCMLKTLRLK